MEVSNWNDNDNWNVFEIPLSKRNLLLYSQNEADVKFVFNVKPNLQMFINAHKRILSIGSCIFEQMFYGLMASYTTDENVYITDISIECFKNLLMFIYIGAVELNLENIFEVMYAAHKYEVCKLESLCCNFLYKNMDISNVFEIYEISSVFNNSITKQCLEWIDDLFNDLTKSDGFMNLKKPALMELIKRDTLNISEINLFKSVYKWAEKQCCDASIEPSVENLRRAVDSFKSIRFPAMTFNEFAECTRYGLNILTPAERVDVWDGISKVKQSLLFSSTKRIQSPISLKALLLHYVPAPFDSSVNYTFELWVRRIVYVNTISVVRNCTLTITKEPETYQYEGSEYMIHANEVKSIKYTFMPNVKYALTTADCSFRCEKKCYRCPRFQNYNEMHQYYNRITKASSWNFIEHDPFYFENPQNSLIRMITFKMSK